ncbi:MAG: hypothetical protein J6C59_02470 [Muribaculaceae bacterium]|nr:hypothetical protein [Muribaculaceae bacterium]
MRTSRLTLQGALALLLMAAACDSKTAGRQESDTAADVQDVQAKIDSLAQIKADSMVRAQAKPKAKAEEAMQVPDSKVDRIVDKYNDCTSTLETMMNDGVLNTSSVATRAIESMDVPDDEYDQIKSRLTPRQKSRVEAARNKFNRTVDEWNDYRPEL